MIVPSKKLEQYIKLYEDRKVLCERFGMDESVLSRLLNRQRGASSRHIQNVLEATRFTFEEAWEMTEGDGEAD